MIKHLIKLIFSSLIMLSSSCIFSYDEKEPEKNIIGNFFINHNGNYHSLIYHEQGSIGKNVILMSLDSVAVYGIYILAIENSNYLVIDTSSKKILKTYYNHSEFESKKTEFQIPEITFKKVE